MYRQVVSSKTIRSSDLARGSGDRGPLWFEVTMEMRKTVELVGLYYFSY